MATQRPTTQLSMPSSVHLATRERHKPRTVRHSQQLRRRFARVFGRADSILDAYGANDYLDMDGESSSDDSSTYSQDINHRSVRSNHNGHSSKEGNGGVRSKHRGRSSKKVTSNATFDTIASVTYSQDGSNQGVQSEHHARSSKRVTSFATFDDTNAPVTYSQDDNNLAVYPKQHIHSDGETTSNTAFDGTSAPVNYSQDSSIQGVQSKQHIRYFGESNGNAIFDDTSAPVVYSQDGSNQSIHSEHHARYFGESTGNATFISSSAPVAYSQDDSNQNVHSEHHTRSHEEGTGNASSDEPSARVDNDDQYRRPSWTDHRATCESCAQLADVDSSRPSTFFALGGAATTRSTRNVSRYNSTATLAAESDATNQSSIWQGIDDLLEVDALTPSHEPAKAQRPIRPALKAEDQFLSSASTQVERIREPDGITAKGRSTQDASTHFGFDSSQSQIDPIEPEDELYSEKPRVHQHGQKGIKPRLAVREIEKDGDSDQDRGAEKLPRRQHGAQVLLRRTSRLAQILIWIVMISLPLFFITLAVLTAFINKKPAPSDIGNGVAAANKIAVSVWPIVFAAIVAQSLRMYAAFRAERGIPLMTLEQLMSSHSVGSALKQPFVLWRFNWVAMMLMGLWSLSPLAGQALLHMSYQDQKSSNSSQTWSYLNTSGDSNVFSAGSNHSSYSSNVDSIFGASIFSGTDMQQAPADPWNNTKIPILPKQQSGNMSKWIPIDDTQPYSSLVGVPIANFTISDPDIEEYEIDITIRSTYFAFDCPVLLPGNLSQIQQIAQIQNINLTKSSTGTLWLGLLPPQDQQPGQLLFVSKPFKSIQQNTHLYTTCNFTPTHVESEIKCDDQYCWVYQMRLDTGPDLPTSQTPLAQSLLNMVSYFLQSGNPYNPSDKASPQPSPKEYYLVNSSNANSVNGKFDLSTVPAEDFTQRLTLLFNTYWQVSLAPWDYTGEVQKEGNSPLLTQPAIITKWITVYRADWAWLVVLLVSSTILLVAAVAFAIWDARTVGPQIFGFASSLTHRNKYMRVPNGGSTIGGAARARQLRNVRVMVQDVAPGQEVGKIVLGTVDGNAGQRLKLGRLYR